MPLPIFTTQQVINQLNSGSRWTASNITYAFPGNSTPISGNSVVKSTFSSVPINIRSTFELAIGLWDDLIPQSFKAFQGTLSTATSADLEFGYFSATSEGYAFAYRPTIGSIWFSTSIGNDSWNGLLNPTIGRHGFVTFIHEMGHALGLVHMGNYNGATGSGPSSFQDSAVYTVT